MEELVKQRRYMKNKFILMVSTSHSSWENRIWNVFSSLLFSWNFTLKKIVTALVKASSRIRSNLSLKIIQKLQPSPPARFICVLALEKHVIKYTERISFSLLELHYYCSFYHNNFHFIFYLLAPCCQYMVNDIV